MVRGLSWWLIFVCASLTLRADVKLPGIFGDHMVLQQGAKLPVWGWADAGEVVTITIGSDTATATADPAGKWRVDLPPLPADSRSVTLTVAGKNVICLRDVLVGDVWLCSGQSNMEFGLLHELHGAETIASATDTSIRLFLVKHVASLQPVEDTETDKDVMGRWEVCSPAILGPEWGGGFSPYSAVGYYFVRELRHTYGHPVGLIDNPFGGTPAEAWTSLSGLEKEPQLAHHVAEHKRLVDGFAQATADYPAKIVAYQAALANWEAKGGKAFDEMLKAWLIESRKNEIAGKVSPPKPKPFAPKPVVPTGPDGGWMAPANLYNGMVAPLVPFAIKGVIWYQGENNSGAAAEYGVLFPRMIADWREKWGQGDFPFLFVQLANFQGGRPDAIQSWPYLRESQARALALPNTGMITAIDLGNPANIHPIDKRDVAMRLVAVARHVAYGEDLICSGPTFATAQVQEHAIRVSFSQVGGGLVIGKPPWVAAGNTLPPAGKLAGFTLAGADKKWFPAEARIDGNAVILSSPQVASPIHVRYDWANAPQGNLYNKEGWPAFPFRTDDWADPVAMGLVPAPAGK